MRIKAQYLPIKVLIPIALVIEIIFLDLTLAQVFAQTNTSSVQCTKANVNASINKLETGDTAAFDFLVACNSKAVPSLIKLLDHNDKNIRIVAIAILGEIGAGATEAIPFFEEILKDTQEDNEDSRLMVVNALGKMCQPAVPILITAFKYNNWEVQHAAIQSLVYIGQPAVPTLVALVQDEDSSVRSHAAEALGGIGAEAKDAVPILIAALRDKNKWVRSSAAKALGEIGTEAKDAVPTLIAALEDEDNWMHSSAVKALGGIGQPALPALIAALRDEDSSVRSSAAEAIKEIGAEAKDAVPELSIVLHNSSEIIKVRYAVVEALVSIKSNEAHSVLRKSEEILDFVIKEYIRSLPPCPTCARVIAVASATQAIKKSKPLTMCQFPLIRTILKWKC